MTSLFWSLSADEQVILALIFSLILSEGLNENELNILGNFIEAVGQNILLIQAAVSAQTTDNTPICVNSTDIQELRTRIDALEARL
ncbi:MAG: hypothetical protein IIX92_03430 [Selenomonadales bacterium]|nr:hypothetical protein [Selenomonadales bacterium]